MVSEAELDNNLLAQFKPEFRAALKWRTDLKKQLKANGVGIEVTHERNMDLANVAMPLQGKFRALERQSEHTQQQLQSYDVESSEGVIRKLREEIWISKKGWEGPEADQPVVDAPEVSHSKNLGKLSSSKIEMHHQGVQKKVTVAGDSKLLRKTLSRATIGVNEDIAQVPSSPELQKGEYAFLSRDITEKQKEAREKRAQHRAGNPT